MTSSSGPRPLNRTFYHFRPQPWTPAPKPRTLRPWLRWGANPLSGYSTDHDQRDFLRYSEIPLDSSDPS